jgi:siderophore synthetase component
MYKLSLNVRITNSERVNKSWELDRVLETARMMQLPVAKDIKVSAPDFVIVNEPAYITIKVDGKVLDGFSCIFRDASDFIDPARDISAVTTLVQDNPLGGPSRLANIIGRLAKQEGRSVEDVTMDWFDRYITVSIESLMKLFIDWGLCFEPHGQNTLIELVGGYPTRCFCRDGQGFFHRQASHADWCEVMPGKGEVTESIFPEDLARERLIYYPFINQVFSVINALGTQRLSDEELLMARLRERMSALADQPQRYPFSLLEVLENSERLPCKGNLLTQLYNMDELVGDIATQSVYVTLPNIYSSKTQRQAEAV